MEKNDSIFQEQSLIENILISEIFIFMKKKKAIPMLPMAQVGTFNVNRKYLTFNVNRKY